MCQSASYFAHPMIVWSKLLSSSKSKTNVAIQWPQCKSPQGCQFKNTDAQTYQMIEKIEDLLITLLEYARYRSRLIHVLRQFRKIWDGHLRQINTATTRVDLSSPEPRPLYAVPYSADVKSRKAEEKKLIKRSRWKVSNMCRRSTLHQSYLS